MYRRLGSGEHLLWLYDRVAPIHFSLTATIAGELQVEQLEKSLTWMQRKHPLLRSGIVVDESGQPWLAETTDLIPLRVLQRQDEHHWQQEVERELAEPFALTQSPLLRAVLLQSTDISELIITCHHSIGDGLSVAYLLRDILDAIATGVPQPLPKRPSLEGLIPNLVPMPKAELPVLESDSIVPSSPRLLCWSLSHQDTASLVSRCRQEKTSVHSAIGAAFLLAIFEQNSHSDRILKCLSPINLRRYLSPAIEEDFGYYIGRGLTVHSLTNGMSLWDIARSLKKQLNEQMSPDNIFSGVPQRQAIASANPSLGFIYPFMQQILDCDVMVTNLGRLDFPQQFGRLQLQAIRGPAVLTRIKNERAIGVATLGGKMFFTIAYCASASVKGLQERAMELIIG